MSIILSNGRWFLAGGRFVTSEAGAGGSPGGDPGGGNPGGGTPPPTNETLSVAVENFKLGNTAGRWNFQRKAGQDWCDIPIMGRYTGVAPAIVQARVINRLDTTKEIVPWSNLTFLQVNDTELTFLGYLPEVPVGMDYLVEVRVSDQLVSRGTTPWGVGSNGFIFGQSNQVGALQAFSYSDVVAGSNPQRTELSWLRNVGGLGIWGVDGWVMSGGITGSSGSTGTGSNVSASNGGVMALGRYVGAALKKKYGRECGVGIIPWAHNSTSLEAFIPGGGRYNIFTNSGTAAGSIGLASPKDYAFGDFEYADLHQGEANNGQTVEQRLASLIKACEMLHTHVAQFGRQPHQLAIRIAVLGVYPNLGKIEDIRKAVYKLEEHAKQNGWNVEVSRTCLDLPPTDGLHYGGDDKKRSLMRMAQSWINALDPVMFPFSGAGPRLAGTATREGNVVLLPVVHDGGTLLRPKDAAQPITGWYGNTATDFSGTDHNPSSVAVVGGMVQLTFPDGTPWPLAIKHCGGKLGTAQSSYPAIGNLLYDEVRYPSSVTEPGDQFYGFPLQPTPDAIMVN